MSASQGSRRFWTEVDVAEQPDGFAVRLDGKPVRLPDAGALLLPNRTLAEAVASEWRRIDGPYGPEAIGLTRLAGSMLFRVAPRREAVKDQLMGFLDGDLLCYRADHPEGLARRQERDWQPWLDWVREGFGVSLRTTLGLMPVRQPEAARAAMATALDGLDDAALTALGVLAPALSSLVLGVACVSGALAAETAFELSVLDDRYQSERWGEDKEAAGRRAALRADCVEARRFLDLARGVGTTRLLVEGRVQGVGYRAWLRAEAQALGLGGFVRNLPGGEVEAMLFGPEPARASLELRARTGPRMADVRDVRREDGLEPLETRDSHVPFEIRRDA
ncbi:acylphosphatase [Acetobacteraceae bacterium KSS8]|uniref:acylphosphatase n=1 Tax=Endosaccharibacter trunci TaxID=2812733 RepID=A0ABT1W987_9PROT|nr:acylphosphatase [Acetobacteraceae bacterium KSS8]